MNRLGQTKKMTVPFSLKKKKSRQIKKEIRRMKAYTKSFASGTKSNQLLMKKETYNELNILLGRRGYFF